MRLPTPFGKYLLLERISVGGMAEVFKAKAFGVEGFEKIIAIKKILPSMAEDADFIQMFIDEAKICGQLNHANTSPKTPSYRAPGPTLLASYCPLSANVLHPATVPPSNPRLNHITRCAEVPCVNDSGLTVPRVIFCK